MLCEHVIYVLIEPIHACGGQRDAESHFVKFSKFSENILKELIRNLSIALLP